MKNGNSYTVQEIFEKMAHYCAYQDRCHFEVEKKLNEFSLIPEARDVIVVDLIQQGFLNEERFTRSFVRGKFNQKKWGRRKIAMELKKRNIPRGLIEKGLAEIDEEDYATTLRSLLEKKRATQKGKLTYQKKYAINRFLMQKGYEYDLIKSAWDEIEA